MEIRKLGRIEGQGVVPNIFLGAAAGDLVSVCLTAPNKDGDLIEQSREILRIIEEYLAEVGASRDDLLMAQVWLLDIGEYDTFCDLWNAWVSHERPPALSVVEAQASQRTSLVEIRVYAAC